MILLRIKDNVFYKYLIRFLAYFSKRILPGISIALAGLYLSAWGIAFTAHNNCVNGIWDDVDHISNMLQQDPGNKFALKRIAIIQNDKCPCKPEFQSPEKIIDSYFSEECCCPISGQ